MISDAHRSAAVPGFAVDRDHGFTLIEVMIAIVVVGILTAIALPQYTVYVQRSRVVDATSSLNDIRTRMEQFFQDTRRYDNAGACGATIPPSAHFNFVCVPIGAPALSYTVNAQGINTMAGFEYAIAVDPQPAGVGVQRTTVAAPAKWLPLPAGNCWQLRPGGYC